MMAVKCHRCGSETAVTLSAMRDTRFETLVYTCPFVKQRSTSNRMLPDATRCPYMMASINKAIKAKAG